MSDIYNLVRVAQLSNPELSGYILEVVLPLLTGINQTGNLTGSFYPLYQNPSGYIQYTQTGIFVTTNNTGNFIAYNDPRLISYILSYTNPLYYPITNPAGYISSGYNQSGTYLFNTNISSGITQQFISFPTNLGNNPFVIPSLNNPSGNENIIVQTSGITSSGYWAQFSNAIDSSGYVLTTLASLSTNTGIATTVIINTDNSVINTGTFYLTTGINSGSYIFNTQINSGVSNQFISFPDNLGNNPYVISSLTNVLGGGQIFSVQPSGITSGGYWAQFSDAINGTGYILTTLASTSNSTGLATTVIYNNISINTGVSGLGEIIITYDNSGSFVVSQASGSISGDGIIIFGNNILISGLIKNENIISFYGPSGQNINFIETGNNLLLFDSTGNLAFSDKYNNLTTLTQLLAGTGNTGNYYPLYSNPSGYLNSGEISGLGEIIFIYNNSGSFTVSSINGSITGSGIEIIGNNIIISGILTNIPIISYIGKSGQQLNFIETGNNFLISNPTGNLSFSDEYNSLTTLTQLLLSTGNTGVYYPLNQNPSGYLTTGEISGAGSIIISYNNSGYLIISQASGSISGSGITIIGNNINFSGIVPDQFVINIYGNLYTSGNISGNIFSGQNFIINGNSVITNNQTGILTGQFYPLNSNPAGYTTSGGNTGQLTGAFYPLNSNPSGYITTGQTGNFGGNVSGTFVNIFGTQTISGLKIFHSGLGVSSGSYISGANGCTGIVDYQNTSSVDFNNRFLNDNIGFTSVDWANKYLIDTITYLNSVEWGSRLLIDNTNNVSLNWNTRLLSDSDGNEAIDYNNRWLYNWNGSCGTNYVLNWNTCTLSGCWFAQSLDVQTLTSNGNPITGATGILTGAFYPLKSNPSGYITNSQTGIFVTTGQTGAFGGGVTGNTGVLTGAFARLYANNILTGINTFSGNINITGNNAINFVNGTSISGGLCDSSNQLAVDWNNRYLNYYNGAFNNSTVQWGNYYLVDAGQHISVDWLNYHLAENNIQTVDWGNCWLNDHNGVGHYSVDWLNRYLYDAGTSIAVNYNNRILSGNWNAQNLTVNNAINISGISGNSAGIYTFGKNISAGASGNIFQIQTIGALAFNAMITSSFTGYNVAKTYTVVGAYGSNPVIVKNADTGPYNGINNFTPIFINTGTSGILMNIWNNSGSQTGQFIVTLYLGGNYNNTSIISY